MPSARASADTLPLKYARASDLLMDVHYGSPHMGMHIGNIYRSANLDCMEQVGQRIRAMRKALGLNQAELAQKIGVDQSTVSDIERGSGFSADLLMRLTEHLGGTAALIMTGQDKAVWPFPHIPIERFLALSAEDRARIEGRLEEAIAGIAAPLVKPQTILISRTKAVGSASSKRKAG